MSVIGSCCSALILLLHHTLYMFSILLTVRYCLPLVLSFTVSLLGRSDAYRLEHNWSMTQDRIAHHITFAFLIVHGVVLWIIWLPIAAIFFILLLNRPITHVSLLWGLVLMSCGFHVFLNYNTLNELLWNSARYYLNLNIENNYNNHAKGFQNWRSRMRIPYIMITEWYAHCL